MSELELILRAILVSGIITLIIKVMFVILGLALAINIGRKAK